MKIKQIYQRLGLNWDKCRYFRSPFFPENKCVAEFLNNFYCTFFLNYMYCDIFKDAVLIYLGRFSSSYMFHIHKLDFAKRVCDSFAQIIRWPLNLRKSYRNWFIKLSSAYNPLIFWWKQNYFYLHVGNIFKRTGTLHVVVRGHHST